jgi:hypothetical protein
MHNNRVRAPEAQKAQLAAQLPHAEDVRISLDWKSEPEGACAEFDQIFALRMPLLRSLAYWRDLHTPTPPIVLSVEFIGGYTSSLTYLALHNVHLAGDDLIFPSLLHLSLENVDTLNRPERLLHLIGRSPSLRSISLKQITDAALKSRYNPYVLPCLEDIVCAANRLWILTLISVLPTSQAQCHMQIMYDWGRPKTTDADAREILTQQANRLHELFHLDMTPKPWLIMEIREGLGIMTRKDANTCTPHVSFRDHSSHPGIFVQLMPCAVQELHVHRGQVRYLQSVVGQECFRSGFASVDRMVLFSNNVDAEDLLPWLRARAQASATLSIVECRVDGRVCAEDVAAMRAWLQAVWSEQLAKTVLWNAQTLNADNPGSRM